MTFKKLFVSVCILTILFNVPVSAHTASSSTNNKETLIEYNLLTGTQTAIEYEIDYSLTSSAEFLNPIKPCSIIGDDEREPLDNALYPPFSCIGYFQTIKNGRPYHGTGVLVSDKLVLTAGHNFISDRGEAEASSITFTAGLNYDGSNKGVANATKYFIPEEWVNDRNKAYDWALFELDKSLGNVAGYVELKIEPLLINDYIEIYGYPRDSKELSGNTKYPNQIAGYGQIMRETDLKIYYDADTEEGMSGAPIMRPNGNSTVCIGIHTNGNDEYPGYNSGVKINHAMLAYIRNAN